MNANALMPSVLVLIGPRVTVGDARASRAENLRRTLRILR